ncbi:MAG: carboxylate--amine ligase, partial [Amaricoccus sp.]
KRVCVPFPDLVDELVEILRPHAEDLDCVAEIEQARVMARRGTSADHQLRVYHAAIDGGASEREAQAAVVDWLIAQSVTPDGPGA